MSRCDLFEREGLPQIERGTVLDPHFDRCPDCLEARRVYDHLILELAELDSGMNPSPAWKAAVWSRIARDREGSTRRWSRWFIPASAIAAAAALFVMWLGRTPEVLSVTAEVHAGQAAVRGGADAHRGDALRVTATMGRHSHAELRVYFNDSEVIADCAAGISCARQGETISTTAVMDSIGTYRPVLIISNKAIPRPTGTLDRDSAAALSAGAQVKAGDPVAVR
jgi:hypothetical protein